MVSFLLSTRFSLPSSVITSKIRVSRKFKESSNILYAFARLVPYVIFANVLPWSAFFPFTFHCPVTSEYCTPITLRLKRYSGVSKVSRIKSSMYLVSIQVAPIRTSISDASSSFGCTPSSAVTFMAYSGWFSANTFAVASFSLTLPLKYSSAVSHFSVTGF